jgi:hypothetical protein
MLVAAGSAFFSRETYRTLIQDLGAPYLAGTARRREALDEQKPTRQPAVRLP